MIHPNLWMEGLPYSKKPFGGDMAVCPRSSCSKWCLHSKWKTTVLETPIEPFHILNKAQVGLSHKPSKIESSKHNKNLQLSAWLARRYPSNMCCCNDSPSITEMWRLTSRQQMWDDRSSNCITASVAECLNWPHMCTCRSKWNFWLN